MAILLLPSSSFLSVREAGPNEDSIQCILEQKLKNKNTFLKSSYISFLHKNMRNQS